MNLRVPSLIIASSFFPCLFSRVSAADFGFRMISGYTPFGVLKTEVSAQTRVIPLIAIFNLEDEHWPFSLEASGHFSPVFLNVSDLSYSGIYNAFGLALNALLPLSEGFDLQVHGEGLFFGRLSLQTTIASTVNGDRFEHSSLTTYSNHGFRPGALARLAIVSNARGPIDKYVRFGLALDGLMQSFNEKSVNVSSNLLDVEAGGLSSSAVHDAWSYVALNLLIGYVF